MGRGRLAQGPACSPRRWPAGRHVPSPPRASRRGFLASGASRSQRTSQGLCPSWGRSRRCRGRQGELSFPARPRTALEPRAGRSIAGHAAPTAPPADTGRAAAPPPDPGTASVRPWPCHVQPHGSADPHVPRGVRRGRGSGVETLALSGRPRPPSWFPRCPRLRGHPSLPGHPCPGRGVAAAVPPSPRAPTQKCRPHTHAAASGLATSPTSARHWGALSGPLAARAPTLGRGSGRASGRGAGGPHAR